MLGRLGRGGFGRKRRAFGDGMSTSTPHALALQHFVGLVSERTDIATFHRVTAQTQGW